MKQSLRKTVRESNSIYFGKLDIRFCYVFYSPCRSWCRKIIEMSKGEGSYCNFVCYNLEIIKYCRLLQAINPNPKPRAKLWKIKILQLGLTSQKIPAAESLWLHSTYSSTVKGCIAAPWGIYQRNNKILKHMYKQALPTLQKNLWNYS